MGRKYKLLTDEIKNLIDEKIKKSDRTTVLKEIIHNLLTSLAAEEMNREGAWDKVHQDGCEYSWYLKFKNRCIECNIEPIQWEIIKYIGKDDAHILIMKYINGEL